MTDSADFTHLNSSGEAEMVDVAYREITERTAETAAKVMLAKEVVAALRDNSVPKGDVLAAARISGIMGAKKTSELIPLCHPIAIHKVAVQFEIQDDGVVIHCLVKTADRTGVEMEALTGTTVAGLTIIDMVKSLDPSATLTDVRLLNKSGGRNGVWSRPV